MARRASARPAPSRSPAASSSSRASPSSSPPADSAYIRVSPEPQHQPRPLGVVGRPPLQRRRIPADGGGEGVDRPGPVARRPAGPAGPARPADPCPARLPGHTGARPASGGRAARPGPRPGPGPAPPATRRPGGACPPGPPGELAVGHVPDQHMPERVLGLALDRRAPHRAQQLPAGQLVQARPDLGVVVRAHRGQDARPERPGRRRRRPGAAPCGRRPACRGGRR